MFIDRTCIRVKGGNGGNGCNSAHKLPGNRYKKPDGGNGGNGGNVYLLCDKNLATLLDFYYKKNFSAFSGKHGGSFKKKGKDGEDLYIKVPPGTVVKDFLSGQQVCDLCRDGQFILVAEGGKGGKGSFLFEGASKGHEGEEKEIYLELKMIADVGLVGLPNAGKSTLISKVSKAKSKSADYPFTTKFPVLGTVDVHSYSFVIADIPGIIEGAHLGKGLGDEFLRHIERTKILVFVIDVSKFSGITPIEAYRQLIEELETYNEDMLEKKRIIALNKIDQADEDFNCEEFSLLSKENSVYSISALTGSGINSLILKLKELVEIEK